MERTFISETVNQKSALQKANGSNALAPPLTLPIGANKENKPSNVSPKATLVRLGEYEVIDGVITAHSRTSNSPQSRPRLVPRYPPQGHPFSMVQVSPSISKVPPAPIRPAPAPTAPIDYTLAMEQTIQIPKNLAMDTNGANDDDAKSPRNEDKDTKLMDTSSSGSGDSDTKMEQRTVRTVSYDESKYESSDEADGVNDVQTAESKKVTPSGSIGSSGNAMGVHSVNGVNAANGVNVQSVNGQSANGQSVNGQFVNGKVVGNGTGTLPQFKVQDMSSLITNAVPPAKPPKQPRQAMPPSIQLGCPPVKSSKFKRKPKRKESEAAKRKRNGRTPCRYFGSAEGCKWGGDCYFQHVKIAPLCPRFFTEKGCHWGKQCWDRHDAAGTQPVDDPADRINDVQDVDNKDGDDEKHGDGIQSPVTRGGVSRYHRGKRVQSKGLPKDVVKPLEPHKTRELSIFERIDQGLAAYYQICGRDDYFNVDGDGKFREFATVNGLDEHKVKMELEYATTDSNCSLALVDIDEAFPFPDDIEHETATDRNNAILKVIGSCSKFGSYAVLSCCEGIKMI